MFDCDISLFMLNMWNTIISYFFVVMSLFGFNIFTHICQRRLIFFVIFSNSNVHPPQQQLVTCIYVTIYFTISHIFFIVMFI